MQYDNRRRLSFDDVLLVPQFSTVGSDQDVDTSAIILGSAVRIPVIALCGEGVTANAILRARGVACLTDYVRSDIAASVIAAMVGVNDATPLVTIGLGRVQLDLADSLIALGVNQIHIASRHGATIDMVAQYSALRSAHPHIKISVGDFFTEESIQTFLFYCPKKKPDAFRIGTYDSFAATGNPTFDSVLQCARTHYPLHVYGGSGSNGSYAKAIAAGAEAIVIYLSYPPSTSFSHIKRELADAMLCSNARNLEEFREYAEFATCRS